MQSAPHPPAPLELSLNAVPGSVPEARVALADYARRVGAEASDVELAVAEATSNSIIHGYTERPPGTISLRAELAAAELTIVIADDGDGIRPHPQGGGLGLGLALIGQVASSLTIRRPPEGGTEMTMTFPVAEAA